MMSKYFLFGYAYGFARYTYLTHNAQIKKSYKEDMLRPMLISEKICVFVVGTTAASFVWPIHMFRDVYDIELYMRNLSDKFGNTDRNRKIYSNILDVIYG